MDPASSSTPQSEADRIREKRLRMLQKMQQQSSTQDQSTPPISQPQDQQSASSGHVASSIPSTSKLFNLPATEKLPVKNGEVKKDATSNTTPAPVPSTSRLSFPVTTSTPSTSRPTTVAPSKPKPSPPSAHFTDSFEDWENSTLQRILGVTLDREVAEGSSWEIVWLKGVQTELEEEQPDALKPPKLTSAILDQALLSRLSLSTDEMTDDAELITVLAGLPLNQTTFGYLSGCWARIGEENSKIINVVNKVQGESGKKEGERRFEVLERVRELVVSYLGFTLQDPAMFPQPSGIDVGVPELVSILLEDSSSAPSTSPLSPMLLFSLLNDLSIRFSPPNDDGPLSSIIGALFPALTQTILTQKMDVGSPAWRSVMNVLTALLDNKKFAEALTEIDEWDPSGAQPETIEKESALGPLVRLSVFRDDFPELADSYFRNALESDREKDSSFSVLRSTLSSLIHPTLYQIFNSIVRASPKARERVLDYWAHIVRLNVKRAAMRVDMKTVASDGFMINIWSTLLRFTENFVDAGYTKLDKVDPTYFRYSRRLNIEEETKINADKEEAEKYYDSSLVGSSQPNFITEIFFMTASYLHFGLIKSIGNRKNDQRWIEHAEKELKKFEAEREQHLQNPMMLARFDQGIQKYKEAVEKRKIALIASEAQLLDRDFLRRGLSFVNFVMAWLVRLVDPKGQHPKVPISLPLRPEAPEVFKMLPEFLIEDVTQFLEFVARYAPDVLVESSSDDLLTFIIVFLSTDSKYIKNIYLKGVLVEILYYNTQPYPGNPKGLLGDLINYSPLSLEHFMGALMSIYIDIEKTGTHNQFYEKFTTRYYLARLFKSIWENPQHRDSLKREAQNQTRFTRFVNMLMNDTNFLLDESLSKLSEIHKIQQEQADVAAWEAKTQQEKDETLERLRQHEGSAQSFLQLGNETLGMMKLLTGETTRPFVRPEIVDRLAPMLDYNLDLLAGPKCQELKVSDPQKYRWRPRELLADIMQVFINLGEEKEFQAAVARDQRSYKKHIFEKAARVARARGVKSSDEIVKFERLLERIEATKVEDEADEEEMGEVPDEYLDPIMSTIMRDPVMLPTSKTIIDYSVIQQHLLTEPRDPFSRAPLTIEDCVRVPELKERIDAFVADARARRRAAKVAPEAPVPDVEMKDS